MDHEQITKREQNICGANSIIKFLCINKINLGCWNTKKKFCVCAGSVWEILAPPNFICLWEFQCMYHIYCLYLEYYMTKYQKVVTKTLHRQFLIQERLIAVVSLSQHTQFLKNNMIGEDFFFFFETLIKSTHSHLARFACARFALCAHENFQKKKKCVSID